MLLGLRCSCLGCAHRMTAPATSDQVEAETPAHSRDDKEEVQQQRLEDCVIHDDEHVRTFSVWC